MKLPTYFGALRALGLILTLLSTSLMAAPVDLQPLLAKIQAVGAKGSGNAEASAAWRQLSQADVTQLTDVLAGMKGAGKLGENWIRAAVETIAQRQLAAGGKLPIAELEKFVLDTKQAPRARRLAYELVAAGDPTAEKRLLGGLTDDPSLELRRDAIQLTIQAAEAEAAEGKKEAAAVTYRKAFDASRDLDQIKTTSAKLKELGQAVNLPKHLGFLTEWKLIGPFNNKGGEGFQAVYGPEQEVDLNAKLQGKLGEVSWMPYQSADDYGIVDLNVAFERPKKGDSYELTDAHKEAVAYAYTEFVAAEDQEIELRIGCINANKVWLNGEQLIANQVYHAGMEVDQYVAKGQLKKGVNKILVKVAQNAQTESWAQRWAFQLRVCDHLGTAVLPATTKE